MSAAMSVAGALAAAAIPLLPFVGAALVSRAPHVGAARSLAIGVAGATWALAAAASLARLAGVPASLTDVASPALPWLGARLHVGLDDTAVMLAPLFAFVCFAALFAGSKAALDRRALVGTLVTAGGGIGVATSLDFVTLFAFWTAGAFGTASALAPSSSGGDRTGARAFGVFAAVRTLALLGALVVVGVSGRDAGLAHPFELAELGHGTPPASLETLVFSLVMVAALARMAVFPLHAWLGAVAEAAPPSLLAVVLASNVGLALLVRVGMPLAPDVVEADMPFVAVLALVAALHAAVRALGEVRARQLVAAVASSQACAIVVGVASLNRQSISGGLVQAAAVGVGSTGLWLVLGAVEARVGHVELSRSSGLVGAMPRAAFGWFAMAFAVLGFPGTLSFVGEDLLLHGVLHTHPVVASLVLLSTVFNAISLVRAGIRLFFGASTECTAADLLPRERFTLLALVAVTLVGGLAPRLVLGALGPAVERLLPAAQASSRPALHADAGPRSRVSWP